MNLLNKAKRYSLSVWTDGWGDDRWAVGEMEEDPHGSYIREDGPILLAMAGVCEAAIDWEENDWFENFRNECPAKLADAIASLRAVTEKTNDR